ncbi:MAG: Ppx/GppA family phosphatase [Pseudomonadota bacterium]
MTAPAASAPPEHPLALDHARFTAEPGRHVGVIDIGSNSVRLVVYDQLSRAPFPRFNEKALCRLGARRGEDGSLAPAAIDHALRTVERFFTISRAMGVERIDVLATEAVRRAPNGDTLIEGIRERCGAETRCLSGDEEAAYSALGVVAGFHRPQGLMGDLGGGSVEIAEVLDDRVGARRVSLPLGSLPVAALLAEGHGAAKKQVDTLVRDALPPMLTRPVFYAVGGGWRAIARVALAREAPLCRATHGFALSARAARTLAKEIARAAPEDLAAMPGVPARRLSTLSAAALVLDRILKALKPERVVFSSLGLREGWLYGLLSETERGRDPLVEGAQTFGTPRARVPAFAAALVRFTDTLFPGEDMAERRLRLAAAALSDIAWREQGGNRAGEAFRRVLHLPFVGLDHAERVFLAAVLHARHGGKPEDPVLAGAEAYLSASLMRRAQILGRALQLGYRFSGSVPAILDRAHLDIGTDRVRLVVSDLDAAPDGDAVRTRLAQLARALGVTEGGLVER